MLKTSPKKRISKPFDPAAYALSGSEDSHQIALFGWCAKAEVIAKYPELRWMFAVPNGGFRTKAGGTKLRVMGLKVGVPDIFLPARRVLWAGLFIEMKKPAKDGAREGQTRSEQRIWIEAMRNAGYGAIVCYGWEHARDTLMAYLDHDKPSW